MQLPESFIVQMQEQLGQEFPDFQRALSEIPPTSIHFNELKQIKKQENFNGVKWYNKGVYLSDRPNFTLDPAFHAGAYYVQEASSMLIAEAAKQLVDLRRSLRVLDLCAAPGGKSTILASIISGDSLLVANEVIRSRYQILDYNLTKWGISNKLSGSQDAGSFKGLHNFFDLVLVDAPCSGEGLFRKDPNAITEWSPDIIAHCRARQKRILSHSVELLKPGGILLYSTCTYNDQENSGNAEWLLKAFPLEIAPLNFPDSWGIRTRAIGFQCYPHLVRGEGFYLAAFKKVTTPAPYRSWKPPIKLKNFELLSGAKQKELSQWVNPDSPLLYLVDGKGRIWAIPEQVFEDVLGLSPHLRYYRMGTPVGRFKGKDLVPDPALALSNIISFEIPSTNVDKETALRYLKRETPDIPVSPGWQVLKYEDLNLGWIKGLHKRLNNYYPKEWRIRMRI